jgi:hypothetical protein
MASCSGARPGGNTLPAGSARRGLSAQRWLRSPGSGACDQDQTLSCSPGSAACPAKAIAIAPVSARVKGRPPCPDAASGVPGRSLWHQLSRQAQRTRGMRGAKRGPDRTPVGASVFPHGAAGVCHVASVDEYLAMHKLPTNWPALYGICIMIHTCIAA